ncbi:MAG: metal ABC transporter permease [Myxococcota bacterium]
MIDVLFSAFLLSAVLLGVHSYYGLHIIRRGIIFTDLGIGQMAAFGAAMAILLFDGEYMYPTSLAFSLAGAFLIALSTKRTQNHEAFIGLLYAFGMSAAVIALSRAPRGAEEMQHLIAADILFVPMQAVLKTAALYSVIGLVLWLALRRMQGIWRELLFFGTFSVTVTSSVNLAGVLVVFSILVAPAFLVSSMNWSFRAKLLAAWGIGIILNLVAIVASYFLDLPTGHTVVALYALTAIVFTLARGASNQMAEIPEAAEDSKNIAAPQRAHTARGGARA